MEQERLNIFLSAFQIWIVMSLPSLPAMNKWMVIAMATMGRARLGMTAPSFTT